MNYFESNELDLFLLSDSSQTNDNKYLESLETATELNFCMEEQKFKLSIYFDIKRCLQFKRISYLVIIDCFL